MLWTRAHPCCNLTMRSARYVAACQVARMLCFEQQNSMMPLSTRYHLYGANSGGVRPWTLRLRDIGGQPCLVSHVGLLSVIHSMCSVFQWSVPDDSLLRIVNNTFVVALDQHRGVPYSNSGRGRIRLLGEQSKGFCGVMCSQQSHFVLEQHRGLGRSIVKEFAGAITAVEGDFVGETQASPCFHTS